MPHTPHRPGISGLTKLAIIVWMAVTVTAFVAVSLSPVGPVAAMAPKFLLQARAILLPFFHAPAVD